MTEEELAAVAQYQNIIIQHMDIGEPLTTLRKLLETRLQCSLSDHEFYLQDNIRVRTADRARSPSLIPNLSSPVPRFVAESDVVCLLLLTAGA